MRSQIPLRILTMITTFLAATALTTFLWQSAVSAAAPPVKDNQAYQTKREIIEKYTWQIAAPVSTITSGILINEVDAETEDFDTQEFIELFDGGAGSTALDGLVVVFYNGAFDLSYAAYDLDGYSSSAAGYFLLGNAAVPGVGLILSDGSIQNGPDAIAIYDGSAADFPNGTAITTTNLLDALVYDTSDPDDTGLLALLLPGEPQVNENSRNNAESDSNQRCPNATGGQRQTSSYAQNLPTPGTTNNCQFDTAPEIVTTFPAAGDTAVPVSATIKITFSEAVEVSAGWFDIACNLSGQHAAVVTGGTLTYDLDPVNAFSAGETCLVTINAQHVQDLDTDDPPNQMVDDFQWQFTTYMPPLASQMVINEVDADTPANDKLEFIELYDGGDGNTDLYGLTVVLYTGASDLSYKSFDLDGFFTNQEGYFVLGNAAIPGVDLIFADDLLQNGPDAVALFVGDAADFPKGSPVTTENLLDALVYGMDDADDHELLQLLNNGQPQVNEAGRGMPEIYSNQRCPNGQGGQRNSDTYLQNFPTPGAVNNCVIDLSPEVAETFPISGAVDIPLDSTLLVTFNEEVLVGEGWFTLSCESSGSHETAASGGPVTYMLDPLENFAPREACLATVVGTLVTDTDGLSQTMTADYSWSFISGVKSFGACGDPAMSIQSTQGSGSSSPLVGAQGLVVEGVVTGNFQGEEALGGFFIQQVFKKIGDDKVNSDALFVYDGDLQMSLTTGDLVRVQGDVVETNGLTSLTNVINFANCGPGSPITPTVVTLPVADVSDWEALEGMLLSFTQTLTAAGNAALGSAGQVELAVNGRLAQPTEVALPGDPAAAVAALNDLSRITLDDGSTISYPLPLPPYLGLSNTLRVGDTISNLIGILTQTSAGYSIQPTEPLSFTRANERPLAAPDLSGRLRLVTYDAGDYFNGNGRGGGFPGAGGAQTAAEFTRQRAKILSALTALNADIVVLTAVENDGFGANSALQDLVNGLNDMAEAGSSYALIKLPLPQLGETETAVGILYRQETVLPDGVAVTNHSKPFDALNAQPLVQAFQEISSGETFVVAAVQLQPRDDCQQALDGNADRGDGQGCFNLLRTQAAYELERWLATDPTDSGEDDIFILGNLNAYSQEDPLMVFEGAGFSNLATQFGSTGYTTVINGETGALLHVLATPSLAAQAQTMVQWHINADEPQALDYREINQPDLYHSDYYRSAIHDPLIIDLDLATVAVSFTSDDPVPIGQAIQFTNTSSGPGIAGYEWDFGDGSPIVTTVDAQHTYATPGVHMATLTATTTWGKKINYSRMVQVNPAQVFISVLAR